MIRRIIRTIKYMLMPWKKATNALWFQVRNHQKRINAITFKLNELELSLEGVSGTQESSKPRRGRPRKKSS